MTQPDPRSIARYLDGRSSPQEAQRIEAWQDAAPENKRFLDQQRVLWELAGNVEPDRARFEGYVADSWMELKASMPDIDYAAMDSAQRRAAKRIREREPQRIAADRVASKSSERAGVASKRLVAWAAAVAVLVAGVWLVSRVVDRDAADALSTYAEVATPPGQRARIPLDDGTFVRLNVASKIRFPEAFNGGPREVYLEGEAFFEVSEDSTRPFIVHAADAAVRVLGTAFNVRAYADHESVDVVVARGRVALADSLAQQSEGVILTAGQMGRFDNGRPERVSDRVDVTRHVAWMEGRLIFEDSPLRDVAVELGRWYMLDVHIAEPAIADWRLTASFKNESIDEILTVIAATLNVRYRRDRENVTFQQ